MMNDPQRDIQANNTRPPEQASEKDRRVLELLEGESFDTADFELLTSWADVVDAVEDGRRNKH